MDGSASELLNGALRERVAQDLVWAPYLAPMSPAGPTPFGVHLAVFVEPFLRYVLDGTKTIESRFSIHRQAPYHQAQPGDVVLLKRSGGPIVGIVRIGQVWFYELDPDTWNGIRTNFARAMCATDPTFWDARAHARYASLFRLEHPRTLPALPIAKRDRRGWVVLSSPAIPVLFSIS